MRAVAERDWVLALSGLPGWAVERACDECALESLSRPTPAAVRRKANALIKPYGDELSRRKEFEEVEATARDRGTVEQRAAVARSLGLAVHSMSKGETK